MAMMRFPTGPFWRLFLALGLAVVASNRAAGGAATRHEEGLLSLASDTVVLTVNSSTGRIASLVETFTHRSFILPADVPLFTLQVVQAGSRATSTLASDDFQSIELAPCENASSCITGRFANHSSFPSLGATAIVTATPDVSTGGLHFRLTLRGVPAGSSVPRVVYPGFSLAAVLPGHTLVSPARCPLGSEDNQTDELVLPFSEGVVMPCAGGATVSAPEMLYPGQSPFQFASRSDSRAGLYWAHHDGAGNVKSWTFSSQANERVQLPLTHLLPEVTNSSVAAIPYPVAVAGFGGGGWRTGAAVYKKWAKTQPWCSSTLRDRQDVPRVLLNGSAGVVFPIQTGQGFNPGALGPHLELLPNLTAQYKSITGTDSAFVIPYGWENRGVWAGINYFPAQPSNGDWQQAISEMNAANDSATFLLSGFWWVVARNQSDGGPAFDDSDQLRDPAKVAMLIRNADQSLFNVSDNPHQPWRGFSTKLCHGSAAARDTMVDLVGQVAALGVTLVSFDQEIGGGQLEPCYSREHGHPPGYGPWMWQGFRDTLIQAKRRVASLTDNRPFGLLMEQTSELSIPYAASFWSRQFAVTDYPCWAARGEGVFSYLYHEYVTAMGAAEVQGQGAKAARPDYRMRCRALANSLVRGLIQVPFANDLGLGAHSPPPAPDSWQGRVRACLAAFTPISKAFPDLLFAGEAGPPPPIAGPTMEVPVSRQSGWYNLTMPIVVAGTFSTPGQVGTVLASASAVDVSNITVRLAGWWGASDTAETLLYAADGRLLERYAGAPPMLSLSLEPYATRMLVLARSARNSTQSGFT